eukprot:gnl/TRDRNA2_/TRDRNA2_158277_c2_seq5.p1 gnl/TRDRNA2_/TRDRNA2_158277_c2~~gnl/TRDRNA2_/TRDRNA2_158277_c2_seq5.p1  ORF type:complete len:164 (-),score=9.73 gnl/TRDRNA2_/TRDRNA2_158277_c2_seq5:517-1008(-)
MIREQMAGLWCCITTDFDEHSMGPLDCSHSHKSGYGYQAIWDYCNLSTGCAVQDGVWEGIGADACGCSPGSGWRARPNGQGRCVKGAKTDTADELECRSTTAPPAETSSSPAATQDPTDAADTSDADDFLTANATTHVHGQAGTAILLSAFGIAVATMASAFT